MSLSINLAEGGWLPLPILRFGIRRLLKERLEEITAAGGLPWEADGAIALETDAANAQHYEVPAGLFQLALGPRMKYSGAWWPEGVKTLAEAEEAMLALTVERAGIVDGDEILELGCGWGSLTLYMAERFPNCSITSVSNSASQRAFIEARAPKNLRVITCNIADFNPDGSFDRVVSVEMFEHVRNHAELLRRIRSWLRPEGRLFVHIFCHRAFSYPFETEGADNWMGRYFFTGGVMPAFDLLPSLNQDMVLEAEWKVSGVHYARTARGWRENLEEKRGEALALLNAHYGGEGHLWYHRWRLFFLACEELFGYRGGEEWLVGHYRFAPRV